MSFIHTKDNLKEILQVFIPFETGHSAFETGILNYLDSYYTIYLYTPKDIVRAELNYGIIKEKLFFKSKSESRLFRVIYSLLNMIHIRCFILKKSRINLFLAYENFPFYITNIFSNNVSCFEHNNVDELYFSKIKRFLYRLGSCNTKSIVFSQSIGEFILSNYNRKYIVIRHPITIDLISLKKIKKYESSRVFEIFAPSSLTSENFNDKVKTDIIGRLDVFYRFKGLSDFGLNWESSPFFEDYKEKINSADCVLIGGNYSNRISGVMIDALALRKKVFVVEKSLVFDEYIKKYPSMVFYFDSIDGLLDNLRYNYLDEDYNSFIIDHSFEYGNNINLKQLFNE